MIYLNEALKRGTLLTLLYASCHVALLTSPSIYAQQTKEPTSMSTTNNPANSITTESNFPAIEFRRYVIKPGKREQFATYFDSFFPEAFQQLGAVALGQGFEREHDNGFTWLRGFRNMDARATVNAAFYYGPVWKEHRTTLNDLIVDSDNVYLMHPLHPEHTMRFFDAVDPVRQPQGAQGILVAQLFAVKPGNIEAFAKIAEGSFADYRAAGIYEAGVLVTLDAANNFPQLPVRSDGPYLLWLGIVKDTDDADKLWIPLADLAEKKLASTGLLSQATEKIFIKPTRRSRLRWPTE